ncbi:MAG TPA: hypothetical protein VFE44_02505 [Thermoanaerobaculia bacterium]|nr:hypothetical protein [Thermoanaerobaculia bacterium]
MAGLSALLPGLYVAALAALLGFVLRRWFDPVPGRAWVVFGAVLAVLLAPALFGGQVFLPLGNLQRLFQLRQLPDPGPLATYPLQGDLVREIAPWLILVQRALARGEWPLWNGFAGAGEPLLGNPQSQALSPLAWLALPLGVEPAFGILAALRILVALVFTRLFLRRQGVGEIAAIVGALAFALCGYLQGWLGWPLTTPAALLPAVLYGISLVDDRGGRRDQLFLAAALAALLLAGHPESEAYALLLAAALAAARLWRRAAGERGRLARRLLLPALIAGGLAAPALASWAVCIRQSVRLDLVVGAARAAAPAAWAQTATAIRQAGLVAAPYAFGHDRLGGHLGKDNVIRDAAAFAGTAGLLLALLAFRRWRAGGEVLWGERLWLGAWIAALLLLARPPGLTRLPLVSGGRVALVLNMATAVLAAAGCERWLRSGVPRRELAWKALLVALWVGAGYLLLGPPGAPPAVAAVRGGALALQLAILGAAFLILRQPGRDGWRPALLVAVVTAELLLMFAPARAFAPRRLFYPQVAELSWLQKRLGPGERVVALRGGPPPNLLAVYGLPDPRSSNPARPAAYAETVRGINTRSTQAIDRFGRPEDPLYSTFGVRYAITLARERLPPPWRVARRGEGLWIHERRDRRARLFFPEGSPAVELLAVEPERLTARVELAAARRLSSSVYQDGGWALLAGGRRVETTTADRPFVAASLPAGAHRLELLYRPRWFVAGMGAAALALAGALAFWLAPRPAARAAG